MDNTVVFERYNATEYQALGKTKAFLYELIWLCNKKIHHYLRFPYHVDSYFLSTPIDTNKLSFRFFDKWGYDGYLGDSFTGSTSISYYMKGDRNMLLYHEDILLCGVGFKKYKDGYIVYQMQWAQNQDNNNWLLSGVKWTDFLLQSVEEISRKKWYKSLYILPAEMNAWKNHWKINTETQEQLHERLCIIYDNTARQNGFALEWLDHKNHPQRDHVEWLKGRWKDPKIQHNTMKVWKKSIK